MDRKQRKFFPSLAGLRVIMASLVFAYHFYSPTELKNFGTHFFVLLRYRMTIFFVLSGFVIMYSLIPNNRLTFIEYINFVLGKLIRLFPLYLVILMVPYADVGIPEFSIFITNFTLTKGYFKELFLTGIGPSWSLTVEITFYFLAPILLTYIKEKKGLIFSYLVLLITGLFFTAIGNIMLKNGYNTYGFFADIPFTLNTTFFGRATDFYVGILLAWLIHNYQDLEILTFIKVKKTYLGIGMVILISVIVYVFDNLPGLFGIFVALTILHFLLPIGVGIFIYGLIKEKTIISNFLSFKIMVWLGNGSYAFYIMHTSWVQYKIELINPLPDNGFLLLWISAMLAYHLFEKPLTTWMRRNTKILLSFKSSSL